MTGTVDLPGSAMKTVTLPLRPMLGRVAVAPEGDEAFGGLWPGPFGGNMDASDVREGTTVYLPVFHRGALFYFGDGHALQGDGEVCGSGLETSMDVAFRFGLQKKKTIAWPRFEDAEHLMVAGSARPLSDALRIAFVELVRWLAADHGFDKADAYQLVSQTAVVRVAQMVDPLYTVVAKFPKRFLPAAAERAPRCWPARPDPVPDHAHRHRLPFPDLRALPEHELAGVVRLLRGQRLREQPRAGVQRDPQRRRPHRHLAAVQVPRDGPGRHAPGGPDRDPRRRAS